MGISRDVVSLLEYLLPGFIAAWVFYGLTGHPKTSPFERTVQALIFTVILRAATHCIGWIAVSVHAATGIAAGTWDRDANLIWSVALAVFGGHAIAWAANTNSYHKRLYKHRITTKTSLVSEWHSAFSLRDCYIILHFGDKLGGRKLFGWPQEWPDDPKSGHFAITEPEWLVEDEGIYTRVPLTSDEMLLVPSEHVLMIEFVKSATTGEASEETQQ